MFTMKKMEQKTEKGKYKLNYTNNPLSGNPGLQLAYLLCQNTIQYAINIIFVQTIDIIYCHICSLAALPVHLIFVIDSHPADDIPSYNPIGHAIYCKIQYHNYLKHINAILAPTGEVLQANATESKG